MRAIDLDATRYARHALHADDRAWVEKNCYVDIWIETIHALGCEPLAVLPFVLALDFEGDQWTFFKPPHDELRDLYSDKGVVNGNPIIAYCRIGERSAHTWFVLHELLGEKDVRNYDGSWTEWGNLVNVPIEKDV